MVKKPTATEATAAQMEQLPHCADGCGALVNSPKSTFLQGHDQRLIADLSDRVAVGQMDAFQRALLSLIERDQTAQAGQIYYDESDDIMERINAVSAAVSRRFSDGLSAKFVSAAMAKWDKSVRQGNLMAERAQRAEAKAAAPKRTRKPKTAPAEVVDEVALERETRTNALEASEQDSIASTVGQEIVNLRGTKVRIKVGRHFYDATVVGMSQAGKVTAVEYADAKGNEKTTDRFKLVTD